MSRRIKLVLIFAIIVLILTASFVINRLLSPPAPPANWETYTNKDLGFSFNYPKSFSVSQSGSKPYCMNIRLERPSGEAITLLMNSRTSIHPTYNPRSEELKINGIDVKKTVMYENDKPSSPALVTYWHFFNNDEFLWVGYIPEGDTKAEPLYDSILETFAPLPLHNFLFLNPFSLFHVCG